LEQDADWTRPNRRLYHGTYGVLFPSRKRDRMGKVVFVRDTSGSVDDRQMSAYNEQIYTLTSQEMNEYIVIDADASVRQVYELGPGDYPPMTGAGGGGTAFSPAFEKVAEMLDAGEDLAGLVYLTDLYGPEPSEELVSRMGIPVLWVSTSERVAASGRTVRMPS
jgi:Uncharacterized protein conserved in bacteria